MHLSAEGQGHAHARMVHEALAARGLPAHVGAWVEGPTADFRHVVKVGLGQLSDGRVKVGAWARNSREIVPIPDCLVAAPVLRRAMAALAHHVIELGVGSWEDDPDRGLLRSAVFRASRATGEVLLTLIAGRRGPQLGDLADRVAAQVPEVVGTWLHLNDGPGNAIFVRDEEGVVGVAPLAGRPTIEETLNGVRYRIGPGDFFQTNPAMAEQLYAHAIEALDVDEDDVLIDLYCGVGGFALQAAGRAGYTLGVEEVEGAVDRAREGARINRRKVEFICERVSGILPELATRFARQRPTVIVNPARRGLEDGVADGILALRPRRIAYVSCNPVALARDLAVFAAAGFVLRPVALFDMFPHTPHVEVLAVLDDPTAPAAHGRAPRRSVVRS
jgi:23S rRNA (uracil1939-C5)-methyltransferase